MNKHSHHNIQVAEPELKPAHKDGRGREGKTTTLSYNCRKRKCSSCTALRCEHECHEIEALKVEL